MNASYWSGPIRAGIVAAAATAAPCSTAGADMGPNDTIGRCAPTNRHGKGVEGAAAGPAALTAAAIGIRAGIRGRPRIIGPRGARWDARLVRLRPLTVKSEKDPTTCGTPMPVQFSR